MKKERNEENFFRLIKLLFTTFEVIRKVFENKFGGNTLQTFLQTNKHRLFHLHTNRTNCCVGSMCLLPPNRILQQQQFDLLFDISSQVQSHFQYRGRTLTQTCSCINAKNIDASDLDLTLLSCLMTNCCSLSSLERQFLDEIRKQRNELSHIQKLSIGKNDFNFRWRKIESSMNSLSVQLDPRFQQSLKDDVAAIKNDPVDKSVCMNMLELIRERNEHLYKEIKKSFRRLCMIFIVVILTILVIMVIVFVYMSNNVISQTPRRKVIQKGAEEARIIDKTRQAITAYGLQKTYVKTTAVDKAIEALNQYNIVIIMGKVGSGKSTLTLEIAKHFKIKYNEDVLLLDNPIEEWQQVIRYENKQVVILEDVFGKEKPYFHEDIHGRFLESIQTCLQLNKTKVILTTRPIMRNSLDEYVYKHLHKIPSTVIVDLDERFKLSRNEKRQILQSHMVANNIISFSKTEKFLKNIFHSYQTCSKDQIEERRQVLDEIFLQEISDIDTLLGFPLTCHLFCINRAYTSLGATFFRNPNSAIFDEVQYLRKNGKRDRHIGLQYSVLVYTMLISNFIPKNVKLELLLKIYHTVYGYNEKEFLGHDFVDAAEDLNGLFLMPNKEKDGYILQHQTIQEAIVLSFGALCNDSLNLLVKFFNWKDLMAYARPLSYKADANERIIRLNPHHYPLILKRYIAEDFNFKVRRIGRSLCPGMPKTMVDILVRIMLSPIGDVSISAGDDVYFYLASECDISVAQFNETIHNQMLHEMSYSTFHSIDQYGNSFLHYWILEDFSGKSDLFREIFNKYMELMLVVNSLKYSPVHFAIYTGWFSIVSDHIWDWANTFTKKFKNDDIYEVRHQVRSLVASNIYSIGLKQQIACSLKAMQSAKRNLAILENFMRISYAFNNYTVAALENGSVRLKAEVKDIRFMIKTDSIPKLNLNNNAENHNMAIFVDSFKLQCLLAVKTSELEDHILDILKG